MNKLVVIGAAVGVAVAGASVAAWLFLVPHASEEKDAGNSPARSMSLAQDDEATGEAQEQKRVIKSLIRELGHLQDDIVYGADNAVTHQDNAIIDIAERLDRIDAKAWLSAADVKAILVYVLSGGEPDALYKIIEARAGSDYEQRLSEGILRFAENDAEKARRALADIDPRVLESELMGPVSLAKASLYAQADPVKALKLLDDARLINPHTAVEEAAIRRQVPLLLGQGQKQRALILASDYVIRYGRSAYADTFFESFALNFAKHVVSKDKDAIAAFAATIDLAKVEPRSNMLLAIARTLLATGQLEASKDAATRVLEISGLSDDGRNRAELYLAAAASPTADAAHAIVQLEKIDGVRLTEEDQKIKRAAESVAHAVSRKPGRVDRAAVDAASKSEAGAVSDVEQRVQGALSVAHGVIKEADAVIARGDE